MTNQEMKLPQTPEAAEALQAYFQAAAQYAVSREIVERAQESLSAAETEMERAHQVCVDLGILPGKTTDGSGERAAYGSRTAAIFAALPGPLSEIRERTGMDSVAIHNILRGPLRTGRVTRTGKRGNYLYQLAEPRP